MLALRWILAVLLLAAPFVGAQMPTRDAHSLKLTEAQDLVQQYLNSDDTDIRARALEVVAGSGDPAWGIPAVQESGSLQSGEERVQARAILALATLGDASSEDAIAALAADADAYMGAAVARGLGRLARSQGGTLGAAGQQALQDLSQHESALVRMTAAYALGHLGEEAGVPRLLTLVTDDESVNVRRAAAAALAWQANTAGGAAGLVTLATESMGGMDAPVAEAVIFSLGFIRDPDKRGEALTAALQTLTGHSAAEVRLAAIAAAYLLATQESAGEIEKQIYDHTDHVAQNPGLYTPAEKRLLGALQMHLGLLSASVLRSEDDPLGKYVEVQDRRPTAVDALILLERTQAAAAGAPPGIVDEDPALVEARKALSELVGRYAVLVAEAGLVEQEGPTGRLARGAWDELEARRDEVTREDVKNRLEELAMAARTTADRFSSELYGPVNETLANLEVQVTDEALHWSLRLEAARQILAILAP